MMRDTRLLRGHTPLLPATASGAAVAYRVCCHDGLCWPSLFDSSLEQYS